MYAHFCYSGKILELLFRLKIPDLIPVDAGGLVVLECGGGEGAVLPPQLVRRQVVALVHPKARQNTSILLLVFLTVHG